MHNTTSLIRDGERSRLEIGLKEMHSGNPRVCIWKTSPDGKANRGMIAYYNLFTGNMVSGIEAENYPEIDFKAEAKMYAEDPAGYVSIYDDVNSLIELV